MTTPINDLIARLTDKKTWKQYPLKRRFVSKLKINSTNSCWEWLGSRLQRGYGRIGLNGKMITAHRASWLIYRGEIPRGKFVCHKCDNPPCVNPDHLFITTHKENMMDMVSKQRWSKKPKTAKQIESARKLMMKLSQSQRGKKKAWSKLNKFQVLKIRASNEVQKKIAQRYGVAQTLISQIKSGKIWKEI